MKNLLYSFFLCLLLAGACKLNGPNTAKPKLVILLSVDQMRYDYPEKFSNELAEGFKLLENEGSRFKYARHLHAFAGTSQGHAVLGTGRYPGNNGIIANYRYSRKDKREHYSIEDTTAILIGHDSISNEPVSPRNLKSPTLGDMLKELDPHSKSYSISIKDRSSILMAGKKADMAFFMNPSTCTFITSNWYADTIPNWIKDLDPLEVYKEEMNKGWNYSASTPYSLSADSNFHERDLFTDIFPHTIDQLNPELEFPNFYFLANTPFGDEWTIETARKMISNFELGTDEHTDVLTISCSAGDYIGHHFGPNSLEIKDYFYRLDKMIANLIAFLDTEIGREHYVFILSSDHGISEFPEHMGGKRVSRKQMGADLQKIEEKLISNFHLNKGFIEYFTKDQLYFNEEALGSLSAGQIELFYESFSRQLNTLEYIESTVTKFDMEHKDSLNNYGAYYRNSYISEIWPDIVLHQKPYFLLNAGAYGTNHNSNYAYDTDVVIYFLGAGVPAIKAEESILTVDIVPTIFALLGQTLPHPTDGRSVLPLRSEGDTRPSEH